MGSSSFVLSIAVSKCAHLIANYLDGLGDPSRAISPEALAQAVRENRPLLTDAMSAVPEGGLAMVRNTFGSVAADLRRDQPGGGHPYMWVLQQSCLSVDHRAHVDVILSNLTWYRRQMDEAVTRLFGSEK